MESQVFRCKSDGKETQQSHTLFGGKQRKWKSKAIALEKELARMKSLEDRESDQEEKKP